MSDLFQTGKTERRILELRKELLRHQHLYYVESRPEIPDLEYDRLFDELTKLENENPQFDDPNSPTKRVGSDLTHDLPEVEHTIPVLSLDKAYSTASVLSWIQRTEKNLNTSFDVVIEEKIDGSSIVLYYEKGELKRGVTRGNGSVGNDITENVKTIREIPLKLSEPINCVVRGEIFIPTALFEECNREAGNIYANPRNLASGVLRRIKSSETARFPLHVLVYEGYFEDKGFPLHTDILLKLKELGFKTNPNVGVFSGKPDSIDFPAYRGDFGGIPAFIDSLNERRRNLDHEIDGLVIKINQIPLREDLGFTGHHPKWAVAFKFESPQAETVVNDITVQVGRSGRITPLAILEPVGLAGSTISKATLHNQAYIDLLELAVGDTVTISKRGDVIPAVEEVIEKNEAGNRTFRLPDHCPSCNSLLEIEGAHHFCTNRNCNERKVNALKFFVGRKQMDIENLGGKTIEYLFEQGFVREIPDIYTFDYGKLMEHEGFGEKKIAAISEAIEKSKQQPFQRVLVSLGFDELGTKAAELLIKNGYNSFGKIIALFQENEEGKLLKIDGFGEKTVQALKSNFTDEANLALIASLTEIGVKTVDEGFDQVMLDNSLEGTKWVITGSFDNFKPRELARDEIIKRGGEVVAAISKNITHVLVGENAGSKKEKAEKLGLRLVSETEFMEMIK